MSKSDAAKKAPSASKSKAAAAAKAKPSKASAAAKAPAKAKNPIGAKAAAAKLAAAPKAVKPTQTVATPELQTIMDERMEIVGELSTAKGKVNEITDKLHTKNDELIAAGAVPGMVFTINDDPMELTHHKRPSKKYKAVIEDFLDEHPEFAEKFAELEIKHTSESQQQPDLKAA